MYKKLLPSYEVRDDIFYQILDNHSTIIKQVDNFKDYIYGYKNKREIIYNGSNKLIMPEYLLQYYTNQINQCTSWKQCRVYLTTDTEEIIQKTLSGQKAYNRLYELLNKYYTDNEIEKQFNLHTAKYDESLIQYHFVCPADQGIIYSYHNTVKYDINGAHLDALAEIFPKAKSALIELYNKRKQDPTIKQLPNYFVGMLCNKDRRETYNWIVQRTTKILLNAIETVGGTLLYANTDGFIIKDPINKLDISANLGDFKLEYQGTTYFYRDKNYILYQTNNQRGSCLTEVRDLIDLSKNKVVHYDRVNNRAQNIEQEILNEKSKKEIY